MIVFRMTPPRCPQAPLNVFWLRLASSLRVLHYDAEIGARIKFEIKFDNGVEGTC